MNIKENSINDPIIGLNMNNIKKDLLLLKEEALKDFVEIQKKVSDKYSKLDEMITGKIYDYEERLNYFEFKILQLSKIISSDKLLEEKVQGLVCFKEKMENNFSKEKIKLDNLTKLLNINIEKINQILSDSVIYPGIIGKNTKYKTFHEFIDYILTELASNSIFRETNIIDFKSYKTKIENSLNKFNIQMNNLLNKANEFTKTFVQENENKIKSCISLLEEKIFNIKMENTKYIIDLKKNFKSLEQKMNSLQIICQKNNIGYFDFSKEINLNKFGKNNKRYSTSQIKNYIIGKINIKDLLKSKKIKENKNDYNIYQKDIFNKRKSLDALYFKKNKKYNSCFNFFSHKDKINIRKSMFLLDFRNNMENNKNNLNNSDLNSNILCNIEDGKSTIKTIKKNNIINKSINQTVKSEKILDLSKRKLSKEEIPFSRINSIYSLTDKKIHKIYDYKAYNLDNSKFFSNNIPIHYASVIELNSKSNSINCKNKQLKLNNISEIRPVNNLILTSFLSKKNKYQIL